MESNIKKISRKDIVFLKAYKSARKIGGNGNIWLNANEFPESSMFNLNNIKLNRYPDCQPKELILRYSIYSNISIKNILVSRGSDEAIELLMRVFCIPGKDSIMTFPPTYGMYSKIAEIYGIKNISIPMIDNIFLDLLKIKKYLFKTKIIYICSPNNPTGNIINVDIIINILKLTLGKVIVVIDEAYIEFCINKSIIFLLKRFSNLVILRTLSKAFGLAGIRCGFTLAHSDIIKLLKKVIAPYPLPIPSINIAIQALSKTEILNMKNKVLKLNNNKIWLLNQLKKNNLIKHIFYSETNYLLVHFFNAKDVFHILWNQGIILRQQDHEMTLKNHIRISIGTKKECLCLINALKNISLN
ncbi:histidinol-phosphate transaminase [Buchnera aphidicola]|uniref:Histidinol-phosphate aminotransferase n=1 Tax=Buchnera aphidicola (Therioaphis trifolii) TaxID=1241884 RepID=A0A4D6YFZ0_9GAMM|nr:histidinol-phosphate transaminase [Buchnera aphidicola]QCI27083.1 histidinol-phosphate transaminase [Buchnera aphidicola (Therioaphis trifolii)]